ncbi:holin [Mycobacterium phage Yecey3]|uniref:Holin n=1 Tax=Mycobacterium phage Yecey3 TaxID=2656617 RepID=A0A649VAG3_9CAUD|nr:holin [Mycobacterium phage Yecey3]QGJ88763.1 holin [Mycobacterium phage Yecey3]
MTPKIRQSLYLVGTIVSGIVGIALVWGGIDAGAAANIDQIITGLGALVGGGANAAAATKVASQRKDGTFETATPIEQAINAIPVVVAQANEAKANLEKLREAATEAIEDLPVFGKDAADALNSLPRF